MLFIFNQKTNCISFIFKFENKYLMNNNIKFIAFEIKYVQTNLNEHTI